jgi:threonine synthase
MRLVSTQNPRNRASFLEAVQACVPSGGGLYVPDPLPCFRDIPRLLEMDFHSRSVEILHRMLDGELDRDELDALVRESFDFPVPLRLFRERIFALELFHGPTLAFQDFGCRLVANTLSLIADKEGMKLRTVLTATTGNTGAAAVHAFWKRKGFRAIVLHPEGLIPTVQERQCTAFDANILNYAVEGSYDDCQNLVNRCFEDRELASGLNLTSVNSLNLGRILAQVVVYFEAVAQLQALSLRDAPVIAVPCGNCGNLYAGLLAQRMGLPVKAFVIATNENASVPRYLDTGQFKPRPAVSTLAQGMDAGHPSNWERIQHLFNNNFDAMRAAFRWGSCTDAETRKSMWEMNAAGYLPDPHAAVAHNVLQERLGLTEVGILLATAHPAKSAELLQNKMNLSLETPPSLAGALASSGKPRSLAADFEALKNELLN